MSDDLQAPLTPPEVDIDGLNYMPLYINRLRNSKAWLVCKRTPEIGFYMINLWMRAWQESPAGSIEDDPDVLADAAGCFPQRWDEISETVLRGWVKCSDGRLYHPVVVELVIDGWNARIKGNWHKECDRVRKENHARKKDGRPEVQAPTMDEYIAKLRAAATKQSSGNTPGAAGKTTNSTGKPENSTGKRSGVEWSGVERSGVEVNTSCPEPKPDPAETAPPEQLQLTQQAPPEAPFITLPLNDGTEHPIMREQVAEMKALYPATDTEQELRNMRGWLIAKADRRKTKRGILAFINTWLSKAQDNAKGRPEAQSGRVATAFDRQADFMARATGQAGVVNG